jgi:hypothetical protein
MECYSTAYLYTCILALQVSRTCSLLLLYGTEWQYAPHLYNIVQCTDTPFAPYWCAIDRLKRAVSPSIWHCPSANILVVQPSLRAMLDIKVPVTDALKVGEEVAIIGGTYHERDVSFVRSTPKMHYVNLSPDKLIWVYQRDVKKVLHSSSS